MQHLNQFFTIGFGTKFLYKRVSVASLDPDLNGGPKKKTILGTKP